jgi:hypothetical protein
MHTIFRLLVVCALGFLLSGCNEPPQHAPSPGIPPQWQEHTQGLPFVIGYGRGLEMARAEHKPAMMFVTTISCVYCKKLAVEDFNDPATRELLANFVCVIVDGQSEWEAVRELGATQGVPYIVFLSADGQKLDDCLGYRPPEQFRAIVQRALQKARAG